MQFSGLDVDDVYLIPPKLYIYKCITDCIYLFRDAPTQIYDHPKANMLVVLHMKVLFQT